MADDTSPGAGDELSAAEVRRRRPATRWLLGAIGVAAVLLLVGLIGPFRPTGVDEATRTVTLITPAADATFDRTFTWKAVDGATSYRVIVFSSEGTRSFEARDLVSTGVKLSESVLLAPGRYYWQVAAMREQDVIAESGRTPFEIR